MNITCEVIRDLLPLYHDGVCSDGSKSLVKEHLKGCEACRKELDMMNADLAMPHIKPESEKSFKAVSSAWKKAKHKSFSKGISIVISVLLISFAVMAFSFSLKTMEGASMVGNIKDGDICLVAKLAYSMDDPAVGDVIFARVNIDGKSYDDIVRIVALPGDTIAIENGTLYVNGQTTSYYEDGTVLPFDMDGTITLELSEYFVMGDNQTQSIDSRSTSYGPLSREKIKGKVICISSPISNPFIKKATAWSS